MTTDDKKRVVLPKAVQDEIDRELDRYEKSLKGALEKAHGADELRKQRERDREK
jgi:hypothetical protein